MASAPKPAKSESTDTGIYRCAECEAIFHSQDDFRDHRDSTGHQPESYSRPRDRSERSDSFERSDRNDGSH